MQTVLFIGGAWDGRSERVELRPRRDVALRSQHTYLHPLADPPTFKPIRRHTYELDGFNIGGEKPLLFYRLSTLSTREAVALLLTGYRRP